MQLTNILLLGFINMYKITQNQLQKNTIQINSNILNNFVITCKEIIKYPIWHNNYIKCKTDDECPIPYACCNDPIFPMKDEYCCINYKQRKYKYNYAYAFVNKKN